MLLGVLECYVSCSIQAVLLFPSFSRCIQPQVLLLRHVDSMAVSVPLRQSAEERWNERSPEESGAKDGQEPAGGLASLWTSWNDLTQCKTLAPTLLMLKPLLPAHMHS